MARSWGMLARSWAMLARSWAILARSWAILARSWSLLGALGASWRALGTSFSHDLCENARRKACRAIFVRCCALRVLSRNNSDVHETTVLMGPKHDRSMFATPARTCVGPSKKQLLRPRTSTLDAPKRRLSEPRTRPDRYEERPKPQNARRTTEKLKAERSQRPVGQVRVRLWAFRGAVSAPDFRTTRRPLSEDSKGYLPPL